MRIRNDIVFTNSRNSWNPYHFKTSFWENWFCDCLTSDCIRRWYGQFYWGLSHFGPGGEAKFWITLYIDKHRLFLTNRHSHNHFRIKRQRCFLSTPNVSMDFCAYSLVVGESPPFHCEELFAHSDLPPDFLENFIWKKKPLNVIFHLIKNKFLFFWIEGTIFQISLVLIEYSRNLEGGMLSCCIKSVQELNLGILLKCC